MGLPMAKNLLDAGYQVVGYNRSEAPVEELVEDGGEDGGSPAGVAERSDVVLLCLPDSPDVENVVLGESEEAEPVIDGLSKGMTLVDHSTISPTVTEGIAERLEEAGVAMLDAPISGGEEGAIEGTLSIMVGGREAVLDEQMDVLEVLGGTVTHCGPSGAGQTTKACNQIVVAAQMVGVSEALVFAQQAGADVEAVVEAISGGAAGCWTLDNRAPAMADGDFDPGFFAEYQYKDLRIATDAGEAFGAPMPQTALAHELYKTMVQNGMGRDDNSGVMQVIRMMAGDRED
ncbi:6-phosphogluconate dehydrogenase NAD-binding protein [Halalkalicoccus jeotgali B3]|uniref:6-phosphogluconate dehydrogenase NAD-binding protein n=2 Tax=Halalkalicoccus jeotgali TaxID=413810 RepID=D8J2H1_HALJB|nr:6-phosphogluconate dehydrogenase NAD-binding protein [Halalkalicoccus jeotgali B3]ELY35056.1 6-phosphogluconate dehydrogenase NAD-binding protein [Halalkalicoccus jeotgali B3]